VQRIWPFCYGRPLRGG
jgi:hypothetical protein